MTALREKYQKEVAPILKEEFGYRNLMAVPRVTKVVINVGLKEAAHDEEALKKASQELAKITGQVPKVCRAKKSMAGFKLAKGNPIGLKVTLRGKRMEDFLLKLLTIVLPQMRDFRGVSPSSFDGQGHYTLGLEEQIVFPEAEFSKIEKPRGLEISIVTNSGDDQVAKRLLELLGMPFSASGGSG